MRADTRSDILAAGDIPSEAFLESYSLISHPEKQCSLFCCLESAGWHEEILPVITTPGSLLDFAGV